MKEEKKQKKGKPGFSVLELMIAVFVLVIGIVGALGLISSTILNSMATRNATIASGLAQEGVELVRNIRDNNMLKSLSNLSLDREDTFKINLPNHPVEDKCVVFFNGTPGPSGCSNIISNGRVKLYLSPAGFYTHDDASGANAETIFNSYVRFEFRNDGDGFLEKNPTGMDISSYVWWGGGADVPASCNLATKCIVVKEYLPKRD